MNRPPIQEDPTITTWAAIAAIILTAVFLLSAIQ